MNKQVLNPLLNNKPVSKKILAEHEESKKQIKFNKKTYNKEYKELKFLVETKNIIKRNSFAELEKKRVETERLIGKTRLVREVLSKCNYDDTYVWRSEEFLDSIDEQIHRWGNLSPKQKLALNKMYQRFKKKSEKKT